MDHFDGGPTEIRTRIAGFRVQSASRYTMGPLQEFFLIFLINVLPSFELTFMLLDFPAPVVNS
ncbi:hypothetical protein T11_7586 [Trichinella zimbabwensis]|uniref:Uncharacterized protein n=1 Tax=Trichinella zimbabwensis TaxID=268475 RepID=A0A0V1I7W7_9BILA|nr:hypothetical protein T11_7586 [Trichinella zimbabwensis]